MTINTTGNLVEALRSFRLVSAEQYKQLRSSVQGMGSDPRPLAKSLVQRGWLTVYQINQLFAGNGKQLAIGKYRVLDRLGQGGLSTVFKAQHVELDLTVALKIIRPEVLANVEGRQQFLQEIEAMARLDHPNIVQFCDADQHDTTCYFAMEYVDGIDLSKHVRLSGPAAVHDACDYVRQVALGLQHAHERNLVHRDIKPVNLFLTHAAASRPQTVGAPSGTRERARTRPLVKILDWGLAGLRCPRGTGPQLLDVLSKGLVGTVDYLSPEQARNAATVDTRGDIYSLGCTFYYLLTGQPPFPGGTLMQKILKHQQDEPPPVESFRGDVPPAVAVLLGRMLAKNPDDRYQTPAAVAMALMPCTRPSGQVPGASATLAGPKGTLPIKQKDDTPLPVALGGRPHEPVPRLSRAGPERSSDASSDTACA
jgi:eukaryotic-like serine/threonine-protein kinase